MSNTRNSPISSSLSFQIHVTDRPDKAILRAWHGKVPVLSPATLAVRPRRKDTETTEGPGMNLYPWEIHHAPGSHSVHAKSWILMCFLTITHRCGSVHVYTCIHIGVYVHVPYVFSKQINLKLLYWILFVDFVTPSGGLLVYLQIGYIQKCAGDQRTDGERVSVGTNTSAASTRRGPAVCMQPERLGLGFSASVNSPYKHIWC